MQRDLSAIFGSLDMDPKSAQYIIKALETNNKQGFDYLEYKQSVDALATMGLQMGEDLRYQSAFATATTMGLTKAKLIETANFYKSVVSNEKAQFDKALQREATSKLQAKQNEIENLKQVIAQKEAQIAKLQQDIVQHKEQLKQSEDTIASANDKIDAAQKNFDRTHTAILEEIDRDLQKINLYIK